MTSLRRSLRSHHRRLRAGRRPRPRFGEPRAAHRRANQALGGRVGDECSHLGGIAAPAADAAASEASGSAANALEVRKAQLKPSGRGRDGEEEEAEGRARGHDRWASSWQRVAYSLLGGARGGPPTDDVAVRPTDVGSGDTIGQTTAERQAPTNTRGSRWPKVSSITTARAQTTSLARWRSIGGWRVREAMSAGRSSRSRARRPHAR